MAENESQGFPDDKSDKISLSKKSSGKVGSRHTGVGDKGLEATIKEISNTETVGQWHQLPPFHPLPPGVGEGTVIATKSNKD